MTNNEKAVQEMEALMEKMEAQESNAPDLLAVIKFSADKEADFFKALRKLGAELYKFERR